MRPPVPALDFRSKPLVVRIGDNGKLQQAGERFDVALGRVDGLLAFLEGGRRGFRVPLGNLRDQDPAQLVFRQRADLGIVELAAVSIVRRLQQYPDHQLGRFARREAQARAERFAGEGERGFVVHRPRQHGRAQGARTAGEMHGIHRIIPHRIIPEAGRRLRGRCIRGGIRGPAAAGRGGPCRYAGGNQLPVPVQKAGDQRLGALRRRRSPGGGAAGHRAAPVG